MPSERLSGVFLHPTSLPGPHGVGDLGAEAREFVDFLDAAGQSLWQFCPLGPTSPAHGDSPYQSPSAFAGNPLLVDLRSVAEAGYLAAEEIEPPEPFPDDETSYERVGAFKRDRLRTAFDRFDGADGFDRFVERERDWLADYALFEALKGEFDDDPWTAWPAEVRDREPAALERYRSELASEIRYREFVQWLFDRQWRSLAEYADERGVELFGDLPIYVALDSADVWARRELFRLDEDGRPTEVAGVPPNPGDDGQRWGNPLYDWDRLREDDYGWWIERLERTFDLVDRVRLDHFKGFDEFWAIPADADYPGEGRWIDGPGADFFETVADELGELPFVAENLGFLDRSVAELRERFDLPGMRVVQYADWCEEGHLYQPMHFPERAVGYTSTHDTDTAVGYYRDLSGRQRDCLHYNLGTDGEEIGWEFVEAVWNSDARIAITTVQDLLGLGSEARFNVPGTATGNWRWRLPPGRLDDDLADRLWEVTDRALR